MRVSLVLAAMAVLAVVPACDPPGGGGASGDTGPATLQLSTEGGGEIEVTGGAAAHCRGKCALTAAPNARLTLEARPDAGQLFGGWSGACSGAAGCTLALSGTVTVGATFVGAQPPPPGRRALSVQRSGDGSGRVTSEPAGVDCGSTCRAELPDGGRVTLHASAASGSRFAGWSGPCGGTGDCAFDVRGDVTVTARFDALPPPPAVKRAITVERTGDGAGKVTSAPGGIDCGTACRAEWDDGTKVTLSAAPDGGSQFDGWGGACTGKGPCVVALGADAKVTAAFSRLPPPPSYTVTELVAPGGLVVPNALDGKGNAVGRFLPESGRSRAFFYDAGSRTTTFLPPESHDAAAVAVNDAGQVAIEDVTEQRAYRWSGGVLELVPTTDTAQATSMNAKGWIAGFTPFDGPPRGFVWDGTEVKRLSALPGTDDSLASAVNAAGVVVGASGARAVQFDGTNVIELSPRPRAAAHDVNDAGLVVGVMAVDGKVSHGFLLDLATGDLVEVEPLGNDLGVSLRAVNGKGVAVGDALQRDGQTRAMIFTGGKLEDLAARVGADPGFRLEEARDVNDAGQIVVTGHDAKGKFHAAILTPPPPG